MKVHEKDPSRRKKALAIVGAGLILFILLVGVIYSIIVSLNTLCVERCRIESVDNSVEIVAGKIIRANIIANHFGLTNGANIATIPFQALRERMLKDMPNLRDVIIRKTRPNRVHIETIERIPIVRLITDANQRYSNLAADTEGMVFWYPRDQTTLLPIIREKAPGTPRGKRLKPAARAALRLIENSSNFSVLRIQEVDASYSRDYVLAVLGDSSRAKIAWEDMLEDTKKSHTSLTNQLQLLSFAIKSKAAEGTKLWNATCYGESSRIYASDPTRNN